MWVGPECLVCVTLPDSGPVSFCCRVRRCLRRTQFAVQPGLHVPPQASTGFLLGRPRAFASDPRAVFRRWFLPLQNRYHPCGAPATACRCSSLSACFFACVVRSNPRHSACGLFLSARAFLSCVPSISRGFRTCASLRSLPESFFWSLFGRQLAQPCGSFDRPALDW